MQSTGKTAHLTMATPLQINGIHAVNFLPALLTEMVIPFMDFTETTTPHLTNLIKDMVRH